MARSATQTYTKAGAALLGGATATPQSAPMRKDQVKNDAGGFVWAVDDATRLDRFLFLGTEGGTYYTKERELTLKMAEAVLREIERDGLRTVERIRTVSVSGAARKNAPALFALALAATKGDEATRRRASAVVPEVARTGSDMLLFVQYADTVRGWGRALRRGVASWFDGKTVESLGYQLIKYRDRNGWTPRDAMRVSHPHPGEDVARQHLYTYVAKGWDGVGAEPHDIDALRQVWAYERLKVLAAGNQVSSVAEMIRQYRLPWETVPTNLLKDHTVQEAILDGMPVGAMIRQLGRMTANGFLSTTEPKRVGKVISVLQDGERIRKARVHPLSILAAAKVYANGRGVKGSLSWRPVPRILDALTDAFYLAFENIEPINQSILVGVDVSGSMTMSSTQIVGLPFIRPTEAAGAMALALTAREPAATLMAFDTNAYHLTISPKQRLDDVTKGLLKITGGGTDCAQPILYGIKHKVKADLIVILTDNESWHGSIHAAEAMRRYRKEINPGAKLAVVAMASNEFSVADPLDSGMMNAIGVDAGVPQVIRNFALGYSTATSIAEDESDTVETEDAA